MGGQQGGKTECSRAKSDEVMGTLLASLRVIPPDAAPELIRTSSDNIKKHRLEKKPQSVQKQVKGVENLCSLQNCQSPKLQCHLSPPLFSPTMMQYTPDEDQAIETTWLDCSRDQWARLNLKSSTISPLSLLRLTHCSSSRTSQGTRASRSL